MKELEKTKEYKEVKKFMDKVMKDFDFGYSISRNGTDSFLIEMEYWSDLGEDVIISLVVDELNVEEVVYEMYKYEENFDAEEHATEWFNMHGEHNAPTSLRALLQDADEQQEVLEKLYDKMLEVRG